jgi:hypothetical protein
MWFSICDHLTVILGDRISNVDTLMGVVVVVVLYYVTVWVRVYAFPCTYDASYRSKLCALDMVSLFCDHGVDIARDKIQMYFDKYT